MAGRTHLQRLRRLCAWVAACAAAAPAAAQTAAPAAAASAPAAAASAPAPQAAPAESAGEPQPIVVTGQKVLRSTQQTFTSTGVVTGQQIEDLNLRDLRDAMRLQGNVYVAPSNNGNNGITIRGLNSEGLGEPGGNVRPLVTLSIDGATQSFEGMRRGARGTWDIEQIEVARGPQSTLQGRNSMAGTLTMKSFDPTDFWEGAARLTAGQYRILDPALMLSGPLGSDVSMRIAAESIHGRKDISYTTPAAEFLADDSYWNVRGKLLWKVRAVPGLQAKLTLSEAMDDPAVTAVSAPYRDRVYDVLATAAESRRNKVNNSVLELSYPLREGVQLTSITAHVRTQAQLNGLGTVGDQAYMRDEQRVDRDTTQELRVVYAPPGSLVTGVAGLYYGNYGNTRDSLVTLGNLPYQDLTGDRTDTSSAVFGEATWNFQPGWGLTLGGRYTYDTTKQDLNDQLLGQVERSDYDYHAFLPKAALSYELSPTQRVAFTVSTGYRAGFREPGYDVEPEYLTSYELAWRSELFERKVLLNANVFHYDWRDQQLSLSYGSAGLSYTANVGRSTVDGGELSVLWRQGRQFDVGASIGYTRTNIRDGLVTLTIDGQQYVRDYSGKEFPEAPRLSGGAWATYRFEDGWFVSADVASRGRAYATGDLDNNPDRAVPGRTLFGLRGGYENDWLSLMAWVDNLGNKFYLSGRDIRGGAYVGDGRVVGVTATARFY